jgi:hypothetical protein
MISEVSQAQGILTADVCVTHDSLSAIADIILIERYPFHRPVFPRVLTRCAWPIFNSPMLIEAFQARKRTAATPTQTISIPVFGLPASEDKNHCKVRSIICFENRTMCSII